MTCKHCKSEFVEFREISRKGKDKREGKKKREIETEIETAMD